MNRKELMAELEKLGPRADTYPVSFIIRGHGEYRDSYYDVERIEVDLESEDIYLLEDEDASYGE